MLTKIENAVRIAGRHLLKGYSGLKDVNYKGKVDLVTQYDVEVEKILLEELSFMSGEYGFVAEETCKGVSSREKNVYIDPIDGTTNFVHGFPFCCVSVGVYNKDEGEYGIVYNPVLDEMFTAEKGCGAYLNGSRISVSNTQSPEQALVATGFSCSDDVNIDKQSLEVLGRILQSTRGIRRAGSAAMDLCYVAKGVFDVYYESHLSPWDIAAGAVIASEAGADVFGKIYGQPAGLYEKFIFSSTPEISREMYGIISMHTIIK
jgi:myo-inositol-1(or 4)-monophosphatase